MSQYSKTDFIRKAMEQRAVRDDILRRMKLFKGQKAMLAFLTHQLACLPPQLDESTYLTPLVPNPQVHLGGLAVDPGATEGRGEVHDIMVEGIISQYQDRAFPQNSPLLNMEALQNYEAAARMLRELPSSTTLADAQAAFEVYLHESAEED